ncbi:hypothetical protein COEREDRAFT_97394 [Coemansia reversa NRRL 1564]|uniref:Tim44-like domain-containing protein n=1 Tax=Coemansia reversa (strain ATCC 12441 / NRRL 1564) TaxID=763665 RepID=A0A2G5BBY6_COERN|nr:hypothetical protein COEREDRAFT_97394 [Coemansia reversa NRRL 1564]|eukprot:PIA16523.1 hypothetical protein COEREDRAFT_97394 [Coemansia reversa NRRL 1564]
MGIFIKSLKRQLPLARRWKNPVAECTSPVSLIMRRYSQKERGRDMIRFPWIWPSDKQQIPTYVRNLDMKEDGLMKIPFCIVNAMKKLILKQNFRDDYLEEIQKTMIPAVLENVIKAINKRDYAFLEQFMTPDLSRFYSYALASMEESGYQIRIKATNIHNAKMDGLRLLCGPPLAFDASISAQQRISEFEYISSIMTLVAIPRDVNDSKFIKTAYSVGEYGYEVWFSVTANIEISLSLHGKVIDEDKGEITIPLSLSTPHYFLSKGFPDIWKDRAPEYAEEGMIPFQWRLTDIFSIKTSNDLKSLLKLATKKG